MDKKDSYTELHMPAQLVKCIMNPSDRCMCTQIVCIHIPEQLKIYIYKMNNKYIKRSIPHS